MRSLSEAAAFRALYETHHANVAAYCARRVGRTDAEDVAADVFAVAWRRWRDAPVEEIGLPWLYGVAYRVVSHHWRSSSRRDRLAQRVRGVAVLSAADPESVTVQHAEYELMLSALDRLRPLDQEVLRLAVWEELSHAQIASVVDSSETAVRQRFRRAKKALAREFERIGGVLPPAAVAREGGES